MPKKNLFKYTGAILLTFPFMPATVFAQGTQDRDVGEETDIAEDDNIIIVTAQRREQNLQDVGLSLSVLGNEQLDEQKVVGIADIAATLPGFDLFRGNGSNNPTMTVRGVGTTNPWINNNPSVAAYVDDVYMPVSPFLTFPIFDIERVELLKGPQVALYGRNATAGALNFISARPEGAFYGYADVSYNEHDMVEARGAVTGPLADTVNLRLAGITQQGGGYIDRLGTDSTTAGFTRVSGVVPPVASVAARKDYGDKDIFALRGSLEWFASDRVEVFLSGHYGQDRSDIIGSTAITSDRLGVFTPPAVKVPFTDYDDVEPAMDSEQYGGVFRVDVDLDAVTLTSITGYEHIDRAFAIGDFVPTRIAEPVFDESISSFNQEVRLTHEGAQTYFLIGASYGEETIDYRRDLIAYDLLLGSLSTVFEEKDRSLAVFGQGEWEFSPGWKVVGGLRYTSEDKSYSGGSIELDPFGVSQVKALFPNTAGNGLFGNPEYDDDDLSGSLALNWKPSDTVLLYASVSNGYKSGGFDGSGITEPSSFTPYGAENIWAYETGIKVFADRIQATGSFFYYDYSDKQVLALVDLGGGINEAIIQNAAGSEIYGIDLDVGLDLTDNLRFSMNGLIVSSKVTDWESADPVEVAARIGNELPGTPQASLSAKLDWSQDIGSDWELKTSAWASYTDGAFRDIENNRDLRSDERFLANARIELGQIDGGLQFYVIGKNLFDKTYVTSVRSLVGMLGEYYGEPRTVSVGVRYAFGAR
ncbi:TonB-dependent receptor [Parasphingorhabdus sp.]|uniref:TonB-dependent receptor n=1 Tax=Parasphingorhabdus sp. TaxID=2709688 RepID=UPI003A905BE3